MEAHYQQHSEPAKDWKKYFQGVRKRNKHYLNKLWDWVNEQGWFEPLAVPKQQPELYRFHETVAGKVPLTAVRLAQRRCSSEPAAALINPSQRRVRKDVFALGKVKGDVINPALQTQLDDLKASMTDGRLGEHLVKISAGNSTVALIPTRP